MKQRIISAIIGLSLLVIILYFYKTIIFNIAIAIISMIGVYEIIKTIDLSYQKILSAICIIFSGIVPFLRMKNYTDLRTLAIFIFVLAIFTILLGTHSKVHISTLSVCALATLGIPFALSNFIYIRDDFEAESIYYILLVFALAWICDGGAYFIGSKFGKHKMTPKISPNKTVEGAIGGIVTNILVAIIITFIYCNIKSIHFSDVSFLYLIILSVICSFIGILGDLSASIIKRQYEIKDFGNLIPGHGGIVDRFDSVFYVAPFIYMFINYFPILA